MKNIKKLTTVQTVEAKYGRSGYIRLVDDKVVFDTSDEEYGPCEFDLEILEKAIKQHKNESRTI